MSAREHSKHMNRYAHTTKLRCWELGHSRLEPTLYHVVWAVLGPDMYAHRHS